MTEVSEITKPDKKKRRGFQPGYSPPTMWKPGQSGNPGGRPASEKDVTLAARALSLESIGALAEIMRSKTAAAVARVRAAEVILERGYGKAPQKVVIETDTAGMSNSALAEYMRATLEQAARTIEGDVVKDE